ncbi:kinesin [Plasmodium ovale wallikeri]|uniref:Kinesin n=1 Tax=Plasmodium ovale wallikeri TaxID=864142 RepID=A0A1A8ZMR2_PLAOA|nr:kinesin [Plasmodium ovale wallikeri]SBT45383.1 kinesin [Plasmodium ovale wallikeri]
MDRSNGVYICKGLYSPGVLSEKFVNKKEGNFSNDDDYFTSNSDDEVCKVYDKSVTMPVNIDNEHSYEKNKYKEYSKQSTLNMDYNDIENATERSFEDNDFCIKREAKICTNTCKMTTTELGEKIYEDTLCINDIINENVMNERERGENAIKANLWNEYERTKNVMNKKLRGEGEAVARQRIEGEAITPANNEKEMTRYRISESHLNVRDISRIRISSADVNINEMTESECNNNQQGVELERALMCKEKDLFSSEENEKSSINMSESYENSSANNLDINWNKSQIKTCIRIKPLESVENGFESVITQRGSCKILINYGMKGENKKCEFLVDKVFNEGSKQTDIWSNICFSIDSIFCFKNATVFAHGHTGTGKTYTMIGPDVMELIKKRKRKNKHSVRRVNPNELLVNTSSLRLPNNNGTGNSNSNSNNNGNGNSNSNNFLYDRKRSCSQPLFNLPPRVIPLINANFVNYKKVGEASCNAFNFRHCHKPNVECINENNYAKYEYYRTFSEYRNEYKPNAKYFKDDIQLILNSEKKGLIPRACEEIMNRLSRIRALGREEPYYDKNDHDEEEKRTKRNKTNMNNSYGKDKKNVDVFKNVKVYASYMQLYNDRIFDLLNPYTEAQPCLSTLKSKFSSNTTFVSGLLTVEVSNCEELIELLIDGTSNRACRITKTNEMSTRSHSIFKIELRYVNNLKPECLKSGNLLLIDLAGNEKYAASNEKLYTTEVCSINRSLSALSLCINELSKGNKNISYRNSVLTRLLQDSLGGSSKTVFICTISASLKNVRDTLSSLKLVSKAKKIQFENKNTNSYIYEEDIKKLKKELYFLKKFVFFQYITNKYESKKRLKKIKEFYFGNSPSVVGKAIFTGSSEDSEECTFIDDANDECNSICGMSENRKNDNSEREDNTIRSSSCRSIVNCKNDSENLKGDEKLSDRKDRKGEKDSSDEKLLNQSIEETIDMDVLNGKDNTYKGIENIYNDYELTSFNSLLYQWNLNKSSIKKVKDKVLKNVNDKKNLWFHHNGNINKKSIMNFIETHTIEYEIETDDELNNESSAYDKLAACDDSGEGGDYDGGDDNGNNDSENENDIEAYACSDMEETDDVSCYDDEYAKGETAKGELAKEREKNVKGKAGKGKTHTPSSCGKHSEEAKEGNNMYEEGTGGETDECAQKGEDSQEDRRFNYFRVTKRGANKRENCDARIYMKDSKKDENLKNGKGDFYMEDAIYYEKVNNRCDKETNDKKEGDLVFCVPKEDVQNGKNNFEKAINAKRKNQTYNFQTELRSSKDSKMGSLVTRKRMHIIEKYKERKLMRGNKNEGNTAFVCNFHMNINRKKGVSSVFKNRLDESNAKHVVEKKKKKEKFIKAKRKVKRSHNSNNDNCKSDVTECSSLSSGKGIKKGMQYVELRKIHASPHSLEVNNSTTFASLGSVTVSSSTECGKAEKSEQKRMHKEKISVKDSNDTIEPISPNSENSTREKNGKKNFVTTLPDIQHLMDSQSSHSSSSFVSNVGINNMVINKVSIFHNFKEKNNYNEQLYDIKKDYRVCGKGGVNSCDKLQNGSLYSNKVRGEKDERGRSISENCNLKNLSSSKNQNSWNNWNDLKNKTIIGKNNKGKFAYYIEFEKGDNVKESVTGEGNNDRVMSHKEAKSCCSDDCTVDNFDKKNKKKHNLVIEIEDSWLSFEKKLEKKLRENKLKKGVKLENGGNTSSNTDIMSALEENKNKLEVLKNRYEKILTESQKKKGLNCFTYDSAGSDRTRNDNIAFDKGENSGKGNAPRGSLSSYNSDTLSQESMLKLRKSDMGKTNGEVTHFNPNLGVLPTNKVNISNGEELSYANVEDTYKGHIRNGATHRKDNLKELLNESNCEKKNNIYQLKNCENVHSPSLCCKKANLGNPKIDIREGILVNGNRLKVFDGNTLCRTVTDTPACIQKSREDYKLGNEKLNIVAQKRVNIEKCNINKNESVCSENYHTKGRKNDIRKNEADKCANEVNIGIDSGVKEKGVNEYAVLSKDKREDAVEGEDHNCEVFFKGSKTSHANICVCKEVKNGTAEGGGNQKKENSNIEGNKLGYRKSSDHKGEQNFYINSAFATDDLNLNKEHTTKSENFKSRKMHKINFFYLNNNNNEDCSSVLDKMNIMNYNNTNEKYMHHNDKVGYVNGGTAYHGSNINNRNNHMSNQNYHYDWYNYYNYHHNNYHYNGNRYNGNHCKRNHYDDNTSANRKVKYEYCYGKGDTDCANCSIRGNVVSNNLGNSTRFSSPKQSKGKMGNGEIVRSNFIRSENRRFKLSSEHGEGYGIKEDSSTASYETKKGNTTPLDAYFLEHSNDEERNGYSKIHYVIDKRKRETPEGKSTKEEKN